MYICVEQKRAVALALCEHLNNLVANKSVLLARLAQPYASDVLAVEADYQGYILYYMVLIWLCLYLFVFPRLLFTCVFVAVLNIEDSVLFFTFFSAGSLWNYSRRWPK